MLIEDCHVDYGGFLPFTKLRLGIAWLKKFAGTSIISYLICSL